MEDNFALIETLEDIENNIITFESYMTSNNKKDKYRGYIEEGICFLPYLCENDIHFIPSKFAGYKNNSSEKHDLYNNEGRIGTDTNEAISGRNILGHKPAINNQMLLHYKHFCSKIDCKFKNKGAFGNPKKFWIPKDDTILLDKINAVDQRHVYEEDMKDILTFSTVSATERESLQRARIGQGKFRKDLIKLHKYCMITGCKDSRLLKASHIKPWQYSTNEERLNPYNGLLLSATYDLLFDKGLISFAANGILIISTQIAEEDMIALSIDKNCKINMHEENNRFLDWHRKHVFLK